jgi:putative aldouronate transport system substrate-binding protein
MVEYFRSLVDEGLLDPESFTSQDTGGGALTISEKIAKNQVFAASGASGTVIEFTQALGEAYDGDFEFVQIAPLGGPAGQQVEPRNFWHGFMLGSDIAESPNFLATLQFLDWLYYAPAAREMLLWGIEGETYTKSGDDFELAPDISADLWSMNPDGETDLQKDLGFATFLSESTESRALKESYNTDRFVEYMDAVLSTRTPRDPYPMAPLDELELEQAAILATPLKDTVDQATLQFILGRRDLLEWDAYVAEVEAQGLTRYMEIVQGAYERFLEQNG